MDITIGVVAMGAITKSESCHSIIRIHLVIELCALFIKVPNAYLENWIQQKKTIQVVEHVIKDIHNKRMHPEGAKDESIKEIFAEMAA